MLHSESSLNYVLLNVIDSGWDVFDVIGGHKLGVPTGHEDSPGKVAQELL